MKRHLDTCLVLMILLLVAVGGGSACSRGAEETAEASTTDAEGSKELGDGEEKKETPVPVEVASLELGPIQASIRTTTNLEAEKEVKVFAQAARLVQELRVEEGDRVHKGDILVRLQDDEQRSALTKVRSQHEKAAREYARQEKLYEQQLISVEIFNNATYEVDQLKIALEDARRELSYTEVRAPISGTITSRLVKIGDNLTIGQHLFDLVDFESIVARVYIPEKQLPRLRVGQAAFVTTQDGDDSRQGKVIRVSPIVDAQTGTVKVTVGFDGSQQLRPGMYVDVNLVTDVHRSAILVPKRALVYDQDQVYVYRMGEERRVERLLLTPILEDKEFVEPSGGFSEGDEIVVAGQAGLKHDALVRLPGDPDPEEEEETDGEDGTELAQGSGE
jgi:membrane fusion protein (multidrug efflux system)